jgi:hypothetical protein
LKPLSNNQPTNNRDRLITTGKVCGDPFDAKCYF